jgi:hypothetical protein
MEGQKRTLDGLLMAFQHAWEERAYAVFVKVKLPEQLEPEIIINYYTSIQDKARYYSSAYSQGLKLKFNPDIQIVDYGIIWDRDSIMNLEITASMWRIGQ